MDRFDQLRMYFGSPATPADGRLPSQWWSDREEASAIARYLQGMAGRHRD